MRNPVQRAWSHYWFMTQDKPNIDKQVQKERMENVSRRSCYMKWMPNWKHSIILSFEMIRRCDDYPQVNATKVKPRITTSDIRVIQSYINNERNAKHAFR